MRLLLRKKNYDNHFVDVEWNLERILPGHIKIPNLTLIMKSTNDFMYQETYIQSYVDMISTKHKNGIFPQEIDDILWKIIYSPCRTSKTSTYHSFSDSQTIPLNTRRVLLS